MRVIFRKSKIFWVDLALFADLISKKVLIFMFLMVKCASSCFELVISGLKFKTTGKNSRNVRSFTILLMSGTICIEILAFFQSPFKSKHPIQNKSMVRESEKNMRQCDPTHFWYFSNSCSHAILGKVKPPPSILLRRHDLIWLRGSKAGQIYVAACCQKYLSLIVSNLQVFGSKKYRDYLKNQEPPQSIKRVPTTLTVVLNLLDLKDVR